MGLDTHPTQNLYLFCLRQNRILKFLSLIVSSEVLNHRLINGASEFFVEALGKEIGAHTRVVTGVQSLPLGTAVALEVTMEVSGA